MAILGFLGKKTKPNLTPPVEYPQANQLYFNSPTASQGGYSLRDLASKRLRGEGIGFGSEFTEKTSNPVIAQREASFKNKTMPFLSNQLSARGVGRSAGSGLATGIVNEAELSKNRDIDEIYSKMYLLNKQQEKRDTTEGISLASNLNSQEENMLNQRASASERLTNATAADAYKREDKQDAGVMQGLGLLASIATGAMTGGMSLGTPMAGGGTFAGMQPGIGATSMYGAGNIPTGFPSPSSFNALGAKGGLMQEYLKRFGGM